MTSLKDILNKYETCNKDIQIQSRAKHELNKQHFEFSNRTESQNIANGKYRRCGNRNISIHKSPISKRLKSINHFSSLGQEPESEQQTKSSVKQLESFLQIPEQKLNLLEKTKKID